MTSFVYLWVIPCQINTKNSLPLWIWTKLGSYNSVYWDSQWVSAFYVVWLQS